MSSSSTPTESSLAGQDVASHGVELASSGAPMKYRLLKHTGLKVSVIGMGGGALGGLYDQCGDEKAMDVVRYALNSGVNLVDTAPWYGQGKSETLLGKVLQGRPRDSYLLNTKVGRYEKKITEMFDFRAERVLQSTEESLQRLGVSYVDVLQVHDPEFCPSIDILLSETLPAMHKLREQGKARFIGITGYPLHVQRELIERSPVKIDTSLVYCHYTLHDRSVMDEYLPFLQSHGVDLINASPLSMGLLSNKGPADWHPASLQLKETCRKAAEHCTNQGVDMSKLAMHFVLENEQIATTLVSTTSMEEMKQNIACVHQPLSTLEDEAKQYLLSNFFPGNTVWEGSELQRYWTELGKTLQLERLYGKQLG